MSLNEVRDSQGFPQRTSFVRIKSDEKKEAKFLTPEKLFCWLWVSLKEETSIKEDRIKT